MKSTVTYIPLLALLVAPFSATGAVANGFRAGEAAAVARVPRIGLEVLAPAAPVIRDYPVATGLILPEGVLAAAPGGRLVDDQGRPVPFEAEATGWWNPEKSSIKWLLLRFKASGDQRYFFEPGQKPLAPAGAAIATAQRGCVNVDTGPFCGWCFPTPSPRSSIR